jgi:hypothetical protein
MLNLLGVQNMGRPAGKLDSLDHRQDGDIPVTLSLPVSTLAGTSPQAAGVVTLN